jgi:hypothetical protein
MIPETITTRFMEYTPKRRTVITGRLAPATGNPAKELY